MLTYKEFECDYDFFNNNTLSKCQPNCLDDVRSVYHAYRHYKYLLELTYVNLFQVKILRVFFEIHQDFHLEEYFIKWNGHLVFNIKHRESDFNNFLTMDFSTNRLFIKKSFYII